MKKRRYITQINENEIDITKYKIYKINKNKSTIYRCNYCFTAELKKDNNKIYKIKGHSPNCYLIKRINSQNKNKIYNDINTNYKGKTKNDFISNEEIEYTLSNKFEIPNLNINNLQTSQSNNIINVDKNIQVYYLSKIFNRQSDLNRDQEKIGFYYFNKRKIIGEGCFSKVFLGEDKYLRFKVAILQIKVEDEENFNIETYILQKIHGKGNFPQLYNTYSDDEDKYYYLIESLMGPNLKSLYKICDKDFDFLTIINIGIDLIKNIKILHDFGFVHRDLKPDNLTFGNLCDENDDMKNEVGILDFSNSKINIYPNGNIKYSTKKIKCPGNKTFSSNNALNDKDVGKKDDLISIFYILIYFFRKNLPWKIKHSNGENLTKQEIIEIRNNNPIEMLCEDLPKDFIDLVQYIFNLNYKEAPDYDYILKELIKLTIETLSGNIKYKKTLFI